MLFPCLLSFFRVAGQESDSIVLTTVRITSFFYNRPHLRLPSSISIIDSAQLSYNSGSSPVSVINEIAGVRMEERSPGSYRLSIRGSLLRSPFGVRNVKVYIDEFPLTDAGGNTYLNLLDLNLIQRIEVLKGPDGSLFGANSGGVMRLNSGSNYSDDVNVSGRINLGSFNLFDQYLTLQIPYKNHVTSISQATHHTDGYREQSAMYRRLFQLKHSYTFNNKAASKLDFLVFKSNLYYQTPGGLTKDQWLVNPKDARKSTAFLPGAVEQNARVGNNTLFGGLQYSYKPSSNLRHITSVFFSTTDFYNSFITNFEERDENTIGLRSYISGINMESEHWNINYILGIEAQRSKSDVSNFGNNRGTIDTIQKSDILTASNFFVFTSASFDYRNTLILEASASLNYNSYQFEGVYPLASEPISRSFNPRIMPRIVFSWLISSTVAWRSSLSRGYSPPTFNEVRSSDNLINTELEPESGYNYETGMRFMLLNRRLWWDVSLFNYTLKNAIVRRLNDAANEYFVNSGSIKQPGIESELSYNLIKQNSAFINNLTLINSFSLYNFKFIEYILDSIEYSGNRLTGVPRISSNTVLKSTIVANFTIMARYSYTSTIPLNDANTDFSESSHILFIKASRIIKYNKLTINLFAGVDNLLNQKYSLGYDINAFAGRYFNAAPGRNFFAGLNFRF